MAHTRAQERPQEEVLSVQGFGRAAQCKGRAAGPVGKAMQEVECKGVMEKA